MRQTLIAGNWKLNGSKQSIIDLLAGITNGLNTGTSVSVAVCAPYIYIPLVESLVDDAHIAMGAQNVSEHAAGAYTGEVSATMLQEFSCRYCLVGHSERRSLYNESDADTAAKFKALQAEDITPILCVGETLEEREQGITQQVVATQLRAVIDTCGIKAISNAVIAYEPVWAIGTGRTATPEQAQAVHAAIRLLLATESEEVAQKVQILYGGSMNPSNASALLAMPDIDGGLIGGASLKADDFLAICQAA